MGALFRFIEVKPGPANDNLGPIFDKLFEHLLERKDAGLPVHQGEHDYAKRALHLSVFIQVVQDNLRYRFPFQFDHHTHTIAIGLVAKIRNPVDPLILHEPDYRFNQVRFVNLVGDFRNDNGVFFVPPRFDRRLCAHDNRASPGFVSLLDPVSPHDESTRRKIRARHYFEKFFVCDVRVINQRDARVDHFGHVVRWNVGRHSHGNS
ncbi:MAG: hypothetical protein BWY42_01326 [Candidatus Omnitrophica bacterium ADurb.Bin277]|nr:MAG: hypothetical protein BWY42_01326 [Candidatus Omnitrophica bacterium ADurb.Bin277]